MHCHKVPKINIQYCPSNKQSHSYSQTQPGLSTTSRITYVSATSSKYSANSRYEHRINQIQPKPKLIIPKQMSKKSESTNDNMSKRSDATFEGSSTVGSMYFSSSQSYMTSTINYSAIKPKISLNKYMILCGMEKGKSQNGCSCFGNPCQWRKSWTKHYQSKHAQIYHKLLTENKPNSKDIQQIDKDIRRTYPQCPTFHYNQQFLYKLRQLLIVYSIYDPQIGYVQGMNMIMAVLLYHIKSVQQTFWAFVQLMDDQELRMIYLQNFEHLKAHTTYIEQLMNHKLSDLCMHMEELGISCQLFMYGWLLSLMSNCIPLEYMHLVVDNFKDKGWKFIYKLIITYFVYLKEALLLAEDSAEFLMSLNNQSSKDIGIQWAEMINNCYKVQL